MPDILKQIQDASQFCADIRRWVKEARHVYLDAPFLYAYVRVTKKEIRSLALEWAELAREQKIEMPLAQFDENKDLWISAPGDNV